MGKYIFVWLSITLLLGFEYWTLKHNPSLSVLTWLKARSLLPADLNLSTTPGRTISLWLGWIGFGLMVIMNVYSLRKRVAVFQNFGRVSHWLNFHIFCGLLGPTLIFYHSGLKVRGLVAISFWSMVISLSSGIIGRYFLTQLSAKKSDFEDRAESILQRLDKALAQYKIEVSPEKKDKVLKANIVDVGGRIDGQIPNPIMVLFSSLEGDLMRLFTAPKIPHKWPQKTGSLVRAYAVNIRRSQSLGPYERLMGYWHAFHFPFAVFMYIAATIHIISSMIFLSPR